MSSVSSGAGVDSGGDEKWSEQRIYDNFKRISSFTKKHSNVPSKSVSSHFGRGRQKNLLVSVVLPVLIVVVCSFPGYCHAGKTKKDTGSKPGNFSQSPTNHVNTQEEVQVRSNKDPAASSSSSGDDFWVGSHKLEFKPHPLLMPSTQTPAAQIPLPIIELGSPPTTSPSSNEGGEVDDLTESASTSDEERKGKVKTRKSRGGRKKSRDQRRMAHRTLWARHNAAGNVSNNAYTTALQHNPYFLHNHHQISKQHSPVIITAGSMIGQHNPLLIPPLNSRTDESFLHHGGASNWNINHPGNGIIAPNLIQGYMSPQLQPSDNAKQQQQDSAQVTSSSSSQETSQQVQQQPTQFPLNGGYQQYPYPQFHQAQHPQYLGYGPQYAPPPQLGQQPQLPLPMPPLAQGPYQYSVGGPSGPEYLPQQSGGTPVVVGGSNGPVLMYLGPGGTLLPNGNGQLPSASRPIPAKPFNINEVPGLPPHMQYNSLTGPDFSGSQQNPNFQQQYNSGGNSGGTSSGSSTNPQYFRNNFLRMLMDRMANMGRLLPIPFVTKYASPPPTPSLQTAQQLQGFNRHTGFSRRMRK